MTRLVRLSRAEEYLDAPCHDESVLEASLRDIAFVNRWLGGRRALIREIDGVVDRSTRTTGGETRRLAILDAGTGSGDLPRALVRWARRRGIGVLITACDIHGQILGIAERLSRAYPEIGFMRADLRRLPLATASFDLALLSLTLHHLEEGDMVPALCELARVARLGVVVGELERGWPGYLGAKLLAATIWRSNHLTRHDGPISVRRAFTPAELHTLAEAAGLREIRVVRYPLFRLVMTARRSGPEE